MITIYRLLISFLYFLTYPYLAKKYRDGLNERRGLYSNDFKSFVKGKRPLWVHAVSVGEVQSASSFIHEFINGDISNPVVLSTTTHTGREMSEKLLSIKISRHFYYPWDIPWIVKRAVDTIEPVAYVVMETEIWPNILYEMKRQGIPSFLVNGRFSDNSFEKRKGKANFWRDVLSLFTLIMVREQEDCNKLRMLGVPPEKIKLTGDCKVDALINRGREIDLTNVRKIVGTGKPLFLAGSTHTGEDEVVLEAFGMIRRNSPEAKLVLVPRHPERSERVAELAGKYGQTTLLSENSGPGWDIMVIDQIGHLFEFYGVADAAFVGGSIVPKGGQNLMEPALFGVPVTHGPHMEDFREASSRLGSLGVARVVRTAEDLSAKWVEDIAESRKEAVRENCRTFFEEHSGASSRSWQLIKDHISL